MAEPPYAPCERPKRVRLSSILTEAHMMRMGMGRKLEELVTELRSIASDTSERRDKARRAAAAIARIGGYRWVGLYDVGASEISVIAWAGPSAPTYPTFPRTQGLNGAAVASGKPVIVQDVTEDPRYLSTLGSTRAEMIMPVRTRSDGDVVGTIDVESDQVQAFSDRDSALLAACAEALAELWRGRTG
jgi:L-methionine (R)-S-oxide reductase